MEKGSTEEIVQTEFNEGLSQLKSISLATDYISQKERKKMDFHSLNA